LLFATKARGVCLGLSCCDNSQATGISALFHLDSGIGIANPKISLKKVATVISAQYLLG